MLEIVVHGLYAGAPHEVGAAAALVSWGGEELVRLRECYRNTAVRSALDAELSILTAALDWARGQGGMGETVTVRTGLGSLAAACQGRGEASRPDIQALIGRLEALASDFEGIHAVIAPAWTTASAQESALQCLLTWVRSVAWTSPEAKKPQAAAEVEKGKTP